MARPAILIVDDREDNLFVLRQVLEESLAGVDIVTATSAAEGLAAAAKTELSAALIDLQMPGMDGIEMCRRMKDAPATSRVPLMLMTAHQSSAPLRARALDAGADDFISRPIDNLELVARVKVMLRMRAAEAELERINAELSRELGDRTSDLRSIEARLRTLVEQMSDGVIVTDPEGTIQYVNPAFEKMSGFGRAEALGANPRIVKSGVHDAEFYRELWDTITQGSIWRGVLVNRRKDGTLYQEENRISPIVDDNGTITNFVALKRDVTHELEVEAELRQARKMEALGQLAAGVAHDFNNLLMAVMGAVDLLEYRLAADKSPEREIQTIRDSVIRARDLTERLLATGRQHALKMTDLDLQALVDRELKLLKRVIPETIAIEVEHGEGPMAIHGDASQIGQILMNLLVNARDAMPAGGRVSISTGRVTLGAEQLEGFPGARPGGFISLAVRDTGIGMDDDTLRRIFEPFFTTKGPGYGTGLGLATVHGIVSQHGGLIRVKSWPGRGTTFTIYFPAIQAAPKAETEGEQPHPSRGTETILLVEDDPAVRGVVAELLQSLGYRVLEAGDGEAALRRLEEHAGETALVISDVVMPKLGGFELLTAARDRGIEIPFLFSSGYAEDSARSAAATDRNTHFIGKPYAAAMLANTIRQILDSE